MRLVIAVAALFIAAIPAWATPMPPDADHSPIREDGDRMIVRSEPWHGRTLPTLVGFGLAIVAAVLGSITLVIATAVIGIGGNVVSRLEHRFTTITLDRASLELVKPWLTKLRTITVPLHDIEKFEVVRHGSNAERSQWEYTKRSLRVVLFGGARHQALLPMYDGSDQWFLDELGRRIEASRVPHDVGLDALVSALARPDATSLYRGEEHPIAIDPDRRGVVRERPDHRLAIRLEREGTEVVVTIRVNDQLATRRYRSIPSLDELAAWIADEERS